VGRYAKGVNLVTVSAGGGDLLVDSCLLVCNYEKVARGAWGRVYCGALVTYQVRSRGGTPANLGKVLHSASVLSALFRPGTLAVGRPKIEIGKSCACRRGSSFFASISETSKLEQASAGGAYQSLIFSPPANAGHERKAMGTDGATVLFEKAGRRRPGIVAARAAFDVGGRHELLP
jgi:hypothetical protein